MEFAASWRAPSQADRLLNGGPAGRELMEARIRQIGGELLAASRDAKPSVLDSEWWQERILEWAMRDAALKTQLFRFVDVLPSLRGGVQAAEHLDEYLLEGEVHLPGPLQTALRLGLSNPLAARVTALAARRNVRQLARRFIAGESLREALATVQKLRRRRMGFTMDLLGEAVTSEAQADDYVRNYLELMGGLAAAAAHWPTVEQVDSAWGGLQPRVNVSLKLSALCAQFDAVSAAETIRVTQSRLRVILRAAREHGAFVYIDMEEYAAKELILEIFEATLMEDEFRDWADAGIVLQAYLRDSAADLQRLQDWVRRRGKPIAVRLVKGAYWDTEVARAVERGWPLPVFAQKWETDAAFERLTEALLLQRELLHPAIATHNVRSVAHAIAFAESHAVAPADLEIQMLLGMGDALKTALVERELRLRVYTPYGPLIPGMGYLIRRLLEDTSNDSFLRQSFADDASVDALLADPTVAQPRSAALPAPVAVDTEEEAMTTSSFVNEPLTDFAIPQRRDDFAAALQAVRAQCGATYPLIIDGHRVDSERCLERFDPSHNDVLVGRVAAATTSQADAAVQAALRAWPAWRREPVAQRSAFLRQVATGLRRRRFEMAAWAVIETGKPWREADADVAEAIDYCEFYAGEMERLTARPRQRHLPGEQNFLVYEARGVTAVIAPWNFPLGILTGMTVAALVTGNTVVIKPAEQAAVTAAKLFELLHESGLPPGVANYLPGLGEEIGAHLVEHRDVATIAFTGSRAVGLGIIEAAARLQPGQQFVKRVVAEMGGKNPIVIDSDADLDDAVRGVVTSAFGYSGQKCSACSRVIVLQPVHDVFMRRLVDTVRSLRIGAADDPATDVGPLIDRQAYERVHEYIRRGATEAALACRIDADDRGGWFVGPAIFDLVAPHATIAQEEIFGPVLAVLTAQTFEAAVTIANDSPYALTAGVYSRHPAHIETAKRDLRAGVLYINRPITGAVVDRQPFGGFKLSGIGSKAGGPDYLKQFCDSRTLVESTVRHGFVPPE